MPLVSILSILFILSKISADPETGGLAAVENLPSAFDVAV